MNRPVCLYFEDKYYTCQAISLSEGGIYIRRVAPLPVGTRVEVEMGDIGGKLAVFGDFEWQGLSHMSARGGGGAPSLEAVAVSRWVMQARRAGVPKRSPV